MYDFQASKQYISQWDYIFFVTAVIITAVTKCDIKGNNHF